MEKISRRQYHILKALESNDNLFLAMQEVVTISLENPLWDMEETMTYEEWERVTRR